MNDGDVQVYYFGCWGQPGHYLYKPGGGFPGLEIERRIPWSQGELDGCLAGDPSLVAHWLNGVRGPKTVPQWSFENQPEGLARLHYRGGWTALSFWDRSGDARHGSSSTLVASGAHTAKEMVALFERMFPAVWRRITARIRVELPGVGAEPEQGGLD